MIHEVRIIKRKLYFHIFLGCFGSIVIFFLLLTFILLTVISWKWLFIQPIVWILFILFALLNLTEKLIVYEEGIELKNTKFTKGIYYSDITQVGYSNEMDSSINSQGYMNIEPLVIIKSENECIKLNRLSYGKKDLEFIMQMVKTKNPKVEIRR